MYGDFTVTILFAFIVYRFVNYYNMKGHYLRRHKHFKVCKIDLKSDKAGPFGHESGPNPLLL